MFQDAGRSACSDSDEREGFQDLMRAALRSQRERTPVSRVVVDKMDRFSRDEHVNVLYKRQLLPQHGIRVFSVAERFDSSTGSGRTMERIREAMDIGRSEEIARDTMRAMVQNAAVGHVCGGKAPWGYKARKTPIGRDAHGNEKTRTDWVPDARTRADVRRLFALLAEGASTYRAAQVMNEEGRLSPSGGKWTKTTVYDLARRVYVYEGTYVWNMAHVVEWRDDGKKHKSRRFKDPRTWTRTENAYDALVSPDVASRARAGFPLQLDSPETHWRQQRKLVDATRDAGTKRGGHSQPADGVNNRNRNSRWLLSGLAVCAECGNGLVSYTHNRPRKDGSVWLAHRCGGYSRTSGAVCRSYYVPAERFEDAVLEGVAQSLSERLGGKDVQRQIRRIAGRVQKDAAQKLRLLAGEAGKGEAQVLEVVDKGIAGGLDPQACNARIAALRDEARELRDRQRALETVAAKLGGIEDRVKALLISADELLATWQLLSNAERQARLRELVNVIVVNTMGSGGEPIHAVIHFRGLLEGTETTKSGIREQIAGSGEMAQYEATSGDSGDEADVKDSDGSPGRIRTSNLAVNSRALYH